MKIFLICLLVGLAAAQDYFIASGYTRSALDGDAIPSVAVTFDNGAFMGTVTSNNATSSWPGYFEINVTYGEWNVSAAKESYWNYTNELNYTISKDDWDLYLVPLPGENGWRFVAYWIGYSDLDSHAYGPYCHVYYGDKTWVNGTSQMNLTLDNTGGGDPETTTFTDLQCGHYEFWMKKFSSGVIMEYFPWVDVYDHVTYLQTVWGLLGEGDKANSQWWHVLDFETDSAGAYELTFVNFFNDTDGVVPTLYQSDWYEMFNCQACCSPPPAGTSSASIFTFSLFALLALVFLI